MLAVLADLIRKHVLNIHLIRVARAQCLGDSGHVFAGGGRVGLVDDDGEALVFKPADGVNDVGELLDRGGNDLRVTHQRFGKVSRGGLVTHYLDEARLVLQAHHGLLQLSVDDDTVGHDDDVVEDDLIVCVMLRSKTVSQPSDGVCLA